MSTAFITIASLAAYFAIGLLLIRINANEMWRKAKNGWSIERHRRESVKAQTLCWLTIWPFMLPTAGISSLGDHLVDRYDPKRWEREAKRQREQMAEQQRHISKLEKELGIK